MGTIVSFHAHPDDESISCGGTLALAAAAGHRVVLVFATRGELGEPVAGVLGPGEQLTLRRTEECHASAEILGAHRVEFLGWTDSGMMGEPTNDVPWCFWQADVDHAARRLAVLLEEERPDVLTVYDDNGGYGHPDHIQVHRVGVRAAELAGTPVVAQATINRDLVARAMAMASELSDGSDGGAPPEDPTESPDFGQPESVLTHVVDVGSVLAQKRASMLAHGSQIAPDHFMAAMSAEAFAFVFGTEWFIVPEPPSTAPGLFTELFAPFTPAEA